MTKTLQSALHRSFPRNASSEYDVYKRDGSTTCAGASIKCVDVNLDSQLGQSRTCMKDMAHKTSQSQIARNAKFWNPLAMSSKITRLNQLGKLSHKTTEKQPNTDNLVRSGKCHMLYGTLEGIQPAKATRAMNLHAQPKYIVAQARTDFEGKVEPSPTLFEIRQGSKP